MKVNVTKRKNGRRRVSLKLSSKSKTQQHQKNEVTMKTIMAKARRGQMVPLNAGPPMYGDFTEVGDYHTCLNRIIAAQNAFDGLSSKVRKKFNNDPAEFIEFMSNIENKEEAIELGLIDKPVDVVPGKVEVVNMPETLVQGSEGINVSNVEP